MTTALQARHLVVGYDQRIIVPELSLELPVGRVTAIVGGNGSGKSTLLKALSRIIEPHSGAVFLGDRNVHAMPSRELAQRLSILAQTAQAPDSLTVGELVSYGRHPYRRWLRAPTREDQEIVRWALEITGMASFEERPLGSLSGGQQQRAWIAMTVAQGAEILLLDEPTSHLDLAHQLEVMELLARLNREQEKTVVIVQHDLNLAARYAHHMIALKEGRVVAMGTPEEVVTEAKVHAIFGVHAHIAFDPRTGTPMCIAYLDGGPSAP